MFVRITNTLAATSLRFFNALPLNGFRANSAVERCGGLLTSFRSLRLLVITLITAQLLACKPLLVGTENPPAMPEHVKPYADGVLVSENIAYGKDEAQTMDIYFPEQIPQSAPVILMVHGGGWRVGDKASRGVVKNKAEYWVNRGFLLISINYRLIPDAYPMQQAEDVAQALAASQGMITTWGGDPDAFFLMGHSAGAHLVDLLGAAPEKAFALGAKRWLGTISLDSAAVDVPDIMARPHRLLYDRAFGEDPENWQALSPLHQLNANATPFLLVCSTARKEVCPLAQRFADKASSLKVRAAVFPIAMSHKHINQKLGKDSDYTRRVDEFIIAQYPQAETMLAPSSD